MKRLYIVLYSLALTVGNCVAALMLGWMAGHMREVYKGHDPKAFLGIIPSLALVLPPWFWVLAVLSLLAGVTLLVRRLPVSLPMHVLPIIALIDCIALFCFVLGLWNHIYGMMEWTGNH
jgi:hypothetical protein